MRPIGVGMGRKPVIPQPIPPFRGKEIETAALMEAR